MIRFCMRICYISQLPLNSSGGAINSAIWYGICMIEQGGTSAKKSSFCIAFSQHRNSHQRQQATLPVAVRHTLQPMFTISSLSTVSMHQVV